MCTFISFDHLIVACVVFVFFFKQKTAYEMRISDWSSDVCSSDLLAYLLRFLAIAAGGIESGLARIAPSLDQAAASLGHAPGATLRRVHLPQLRPDRKSVV